ncbi:MAG: NADH-quinone oxidoreductase subunit L [Thermoguttaceae bacterium]|nr:NADH-quinone oxidoreductase subunit L [Thermoguttaceae bacterium]
MESWIPLLLVLIPVLPLAGAALTAVLGRPVLAGRSHLPVVVGIAGSFLAAAGLVLAIHGSLPAGANLPGAGDSVNAGYERTVDLWNWAVIGGAYHQPAGPDAFVMRDFRIDVTLRADPLSAIMLAMVTFISLLVAVYSVGYMRGDRGYWRFFAYIGLFVFSMTMLVSVSNFLLLYVFWEAVGLCSYLLIGFWYERPAAAAAGKKAFLVNRIGDFGFALGVFLIWTAFGTLNFHDTLGADGRIVAGVLGEARLEGGSIGIGGGTATWICLLLLLGACGKSAQFPLHVWLPDAMEGPTPVSALIHAATMVTAGVYMLARCAPLLLATVDGQMAVALIGGFTALLGGLIALTQTDLKRILAYSTISQLGYMFLGLGTGTVLGATAGMFHLFTHAFFKALLFLGAGSVMHAMGGVVDIRRFGGLRRILPVTHATFLVGCLALSGFPLLSGFFSKDLILVAVHERAAESGSTGLYQWLYWSAALTALLTAFYTFRAFFSTFYGQKQIPHEAGGQAHEAPRSMLVPLVVLAVCAALVGGYFEVTHGFADYLQQTPSIAYLARQAPQPAATGGHREVMLTSAVIALAGIGLAAALYWPRRSAAADAARRAGQAVGFYQLSLRKFFIDEVYQVLLVWPGLAVARASDWIDQRIIDRLVNFVGRVPPAVGAAIRPVQNGLIPFYAVGMVFGLLVLLAAFLMGWGWLGT